LSQVRQPRADSPAEESATNAAAKA
jgi:hypothetical protein